MILVSVLLAGSLTAAPQSPPAPATVPQPSQRSATDCAEALGREPGAAAAQVCFGEQELRLAQAAPKGSAERERHLDTAAGYYRKAANLTSNAETKARALDTLARVYDVQHLNEPGQMELVLRELIALKPNELEPLYRLAKLQEDQGLIDAAESTLLSARHQRPDEIEPYRRLAQFYARRATALHLASMREKATEPAAGPGQPDENGVYRVGAGLPPPKKLDDVRPQYPIEANVAQIEGVVIAEVIIDETGRVTDARILRSIPLLDEAALQAVREWRFAPSIVDGRAVPVKMTVTVNFQQRRP